MVAAEGIGEDALEWIPRLATKFYTNWLRYTYPFAQFGRRVSVHYSCQIERAVATGIELGERVYLAPNVSLHVDEGTADQGTDAQAKIVIGRGCGIGRDTTISARNQIVLGEDVLIGPAVVISDHMGGASEVPELQGTANGTGPQNSGQIFIDRNCWLGYRAAILCGDGPITIGRNSVVAANAVVTKSFPPYSVIAGNPAKVIKQYDPSSGKWVRSHG
ncbi:MAG TPA: acyltransferase [Terriglobales bacterium]|nr:acyltransferase [Terriglobales bacterium]